MWLTILIVVTVTHVLVALAIVLFARWGTRWGATPEELGMALPGDDWLEGGPPARVRMTRAVTIEAPPEVVWPWLAQLGRGAGWYSFEFLDNRGRTSARHLVSWIPAPQLGDAAPIGYLRHLEPGRALVWWTAGVPFLGAQCRSVMAFCVRAEGEHARVVVRIAADARGALARPAMWLFQVIDSIMAIRQLRQLRARVEAFGTRGEDPDAPETGARDQYQLYHVIYASGEEAGVPGREGARHAREAALRDGVAPRA